MAVQQTGLNWINSGLSEFISGVNQATRGVKTFYDSARESAGSLTGFSSFAKQASIDIDYLIRRIILLTGAYAALGVIKEWTSEGFRQIEMYDLMSHSITALIANEELAKNSQLDFNQAMALAAPKTDELLAYDQQLAVISTLTTEGIVKMNQMAAAVGIQSDQVKILTTDITAWATVTGKSTADAEGALKALTDMYSKQKVQSEEMTRQLTNRGVPAWQMLANYLGVSAQKAQEMVHEGLVPANTAIKAIADGMASTYGPALKEFAFTWTGLVTSLTDLKQIGLREFFTGIADAFKPFAERFVAVLMQPETMTTIHNWGVAIGETAAKVFAFAEALIASGDPLSFIAVAINNVIPGFYSLYQAVSNMGQMFSNLAGLASGWGESFGAEFAQGIIASATYIINAITYIGNILAEWLAPGSPPKVAPELDKWGEQSAEVWYQGWTANDGSALKGLMSTIKDALDNVVAAGDLPQEGVIPKLLGGMDILAEATRQIEEFGNVSVDTLSNVDSWASSASPQVRALVYSYFEWEKAAKAVKDAQEELDKINAEFEARLAPINEELKRNQAEQAKIRDQERIADLQKKIAEGKGTPEQLRLYALEIEQIKLEAKIRTEKEAAENEMNSAKNLAEAKLDAAKKDEEAAKTGYDNAKAKVDLETQHNKLLQQQVTLLEKIAKENAPKGGAGARGGAGGAGGPTLPGGPLDLGKGIFGNVNDALDSFKQKSEEAKKHWDDLKQRFLESKAAIEQVAAPLGKLSDLAGGIGLAFGSIAVGGIISFVARLISGISPITLLITAGTLLYHAWSTNFLGLQDATAQAFDFIEEKINIIVPLIQGELPSAMVEASSIISDAGTVIADIWNTYLLPAITAVADFVVNELVPVFIEIGGTLLSLIGPAVQFFSGLFTDVLAPAIKLVWDVFTNLLWPVIRIITEAFLAGLVPAAQAIADVATTYLFPALHVVFDWLDTVALPILVQVEQWIGVQLVAAGQILADFWVSTLQPALAQVWSFIQTNVVPILIEVYNWLQTNLPVALQTAADFWNNTLWPALQKVWSFLDTYVIPLFEAIVNVNIAAFNKAIEVLSDLWENVLLPAITKVHDFINSYLMPIISNDVPNALDSIGKKINEVAGPALSWLSEKILPPIAGFFSDIGDSVQDLIKWLNDLADKIASIKVPEWLKGHSPPPMANWFQMIADSVLSFADGVDVLSDKLSSIQDYSGMFTDLIDNAKKFIDELNKISLQSQISGLSVGEDNQRALRDMYDKADKFHEDEQKSKEKQIELQKNIYDLTSEYMKAVESGDKQAIQDAYAKVNAAITELDAQKQIEKMSRERAEAHEKIAAAEQEALRAARSDFVYMAATDPENAEKLYDLKSKQITDLAKLDAEIADAKDSRTRESLYQERAFMLERQQVELKLFNQNAQERTDKLNDEITKINDAWEKAAEEFGNKFARIFEQTPTWITDLYNIVVAIGAIKPPPWLMPGSPTPLERGIIQTMNAMKQWRGELVDTTIVLSRMSTPASFGQMSAGNTYNSTYAPQYNLGVTTNQSPNAVLQSYDLVKSMTGG